MTWFGSLDLAWKYSLIFGIALAVTIIAGFIKLYFDKRKVNNFAKKQAADAAEERDNDVVELNQREKDEGDLFGIRALEAGFYAGIPQSRPVSRASSFVGTPSMTSNTLVGSLASPNGQNHSAASSATTLPLAHLSNRDTTRDSENIAGSNTPRRLSPPVLKLQPSEAELSGRINHNTTVNMDLTVPPSPVVGQHPTSPTINVKDYDDMASQPRSPLGYQPDHYVPSAAPQIPLPTNLRASVISAESQSASFHNPTPEASPRPTLPSSPPETKEPSRGRSDSRSEPQSYFPSYADRSLPDPKAEKTGSNPSNDEEQPVHLLPRAYQPTHQRDASDASSVYSEKRRSTVPAQHKLSDSDGSTLSYNYSVTEPDRNSIAVPAKDPRASVSSSLQAPSSAQSNTTDSRLSEFYDAYYRQSMMPSAQPSDPRRPAQINVETIVEVPTPQASPMFPPARRSGEWQPGMAM